jgi:hypothetical protein
MLRPPPLQPLRAKGGGSWPWPLRFCLLLEAILEASSGRINSPPTICCSRENRRGVSLGTYQQGYRETSGTRRFLRNQGEAEPVHALGLG